MIRLIIILLLAPIFTFAQKDSVAHYYTFGSVNHDLAKDIKLTSDGGYIVVGSTSSSGDGNTDVYLLKVDSLCDYQWSYALGGANNDVGNAVCSTYDGGFVIAASTNSYGNSYQASLMKRDALGNFVWEKTYGGDDWDFINDVVQTHDSGLVFCGETYNKTSGNSDVYIVKTNSLGDTLWTRTIGGEYRDFGKTLIETSDSNIVVAGMMTTITDSSQAYVIKLDKNGNLLWDSLFGGDKYECINDMIEVSNGSYAFVGTSNSNNMNDYLDHYFLNITKDGLLIVQNRFSSPGDEITYSINERSDGKFLASGATEASGAGGKDVHVFLISALGGWGGLGVTFGHYDEDEVFSLALNDNGRMVFAGYTTSYGFGNTDAYLIRLDTLYDTNYNNKFDVVSIEDIAPVSIKSISETQPLAINIFPNPTKRNIEINIPKFPLEMSLRNNLGREVYQTELLEKNNKILLPATLNGVFTMIISDSTKIITTRKLIIIE
ncbi:MAG: T9SS type A sorting domain-containing protein [Flavobacteriales bacterium]|nr:T9SS type A sorting domain-containing protein [Flavobacteriales bacterium]